MKKLIATGANALAMTEKNGKCNIKGCHCEEQRDVAVSKQEKAKRSKRSLGLFLLEFGAAFAVAVGL